jgi:histidine ammonia-lyase
MSKIYEFSEAAFTLQDINDILINSKKIKLSVESVQKITKNRKYLEDRLENRKELIYGINTGFGSLCNIEISKEEIAYLQYNLIVSHAAGVGDLVPQDIAKIILLIKIKGLSLGYSGVRIELIERLIDLFNADAIPVMYEMGSLGASGDLAPLAHLSLPIIGLGKIYYKSKITNAAEVLNFLKLKPLVLASKEGLALLNGTQFSTGYAIWNTLKSKKLIEIANNAAVIGMEGFNCHLSPFHNTLHDIRPHNGQKTVAKYINTLFAKAEIITRTKESVQDPYAYRCIPQVHGATLDTIQYVNNVLETEINSVTDNPTIFDDEDLVISGGNFHAQPIALASDFLCIAMSELANISERRTYQLIGGKRGLPDFLTENPGLNSGLMIAQYTAASIVSQNKQLSTPASVDSIVSCNGQEDHVSMASNAGTKCKKVVDNVEMVLAIEWMTAMQSLEFRKEYQLQKDIKKWHTDYRKNVAALIEDRIISDDIFATIKYLK